VTNREFCLCARGVTRMGSKPLLTYLRLAAVDVCGVGILPFAICHVNRTINLLGRRSLVSWATPTMTSKVTLNASSFYTGSFRDVRVEAGPHRV